MTLNVNLLLCRPCYACCDQTARIMQLKLRLESRGFRRKVALYLSHLHVKFDDKIGNPFEFHAYFPIRLRPKLNWRLGLVLFAARFRSYWDL